MVLGFQGATFNTGMKAAVSCCPVSDCVTPATMQTSSFRPPCADAVLFEECGVLCCASFKSATDICCGRGPQTPPAFDASWARC